MYIIHASIIVTLFEIYGYTFYTLLVDSILYFVPSLTLIVLWIKLPVSYDSLMIRNEIKYIGLVMIITVIMYLSILVFFSLHELIMGHLLLAMGPICYSIMLYISTFKVSTQIKNAFYNTTTKNNIKCPCNILQRQLNKSETEIQLANVVVNSKNKLELIERTKSEMITLWDIILNEKLLTTFGMHMVSEFSAENLVAYIEFTQYKLLIYNLFKPELVHMDFPQKQYIIQYNCIPKSHIIKDVSLFNNSSNNNTILNEIFDIAKTLYWKYIGRQEQLWLNISGRVKNKISNTINEQQILKDNNGSLNLHILFTIFDPASSEMRKLIRQVIPRFIKTDGYKQFINQKN